MVILNLLVAGSMFAVPVAAKQLMAGSFDTDTAKGSAKKAANIVASKGSSTFGAGRKIFGSSKKDSK